MQFEQIHQSEATLSEEMSKLAFRELFTISNWRLYSSAYHSDVDWWIDRFLRTHARIPSLLTGRNDRRMLVYAVKPLQIFRWRHDKLLGEGALFANGAVASLLNPDAHIRLLFVDETTAQAHHYPGQFAKIEGPSEIVV